MSATSIEPVIWFDLPALGEEWEINSSRVLKRGLVKQGYNRIMSLYGALRFTDDQSLLGIRIEILSPRDYETEDIHAIYAYFLSNRYPFKYCIWTYDAHGEGLTLRGVYP